MIFVFSVKFMEFTNYEADGIIAGILRNEGKVGDHLGIAMRNLHKRSLGMFSLQRGDYNPNLHGNLMFSRLGTYVEMLNDGLHVEILKQKEADGLAERGKVKNFEIFMK